VLSFEKKGDRALCCFSKSVVRKETDERLRKRENQIRRSTNTRDIKRCFTHRRQKEEEGSSDIEEADLRTKHGRAQAVN
jgi:hypothetical protein